MKQISFSLIALTLIIIACASTPESFRISQGADAPQTVPSAPEMDLAAGSAVANSAPQSVERMVIQNANLTLTVADPQTSLTEIDNLAKTRGG